MQFKSWKDSWSTFSETKILNGGQVVSASGSETSVSSSTPTSAIIYDGYTSIIKKIETKILNIFHFSSNSICIIIYCLIDLNHEINQSSVPAQKYRKITDKVYKHIPEKII